MVGYYFASVVEANTVALFSVLLSLKIRVVVVNSCVVDIVGDRSIE